MDLSSLPEMLSKKNLDTTLPALSSPKQRL